MKKMRLFLFAVITLLVSFTTVNAQWDVGTDIYSQYVWRGVQYGSGPAIQPYVEFSSGGFAIGGWGSVTYSDNFQEMDLYASYSTDFGLSIGVYDYYYPGSDWTDLSDTAGAHGIEINLGYEIEGFSISANYIVNEAPAAGTTGGDKYFEVGYAFSDFALFVGAGDGWHTTDTEFDVVNVGISSSKEIKFSDDFTLPVSGALIMNPNSKQFFVVVGFSL